jgi:hypothetical protein
MLALMTGCDRFRNSSTQSSVESSSSPSRFVHSVIHKTSAPWDGPATAILLSEKPLEEGKLAAPVVSIRINRGPLGLSNNCVRVDSKESKTGWAQWLPKENQPGDFSWVELEFEDVREDQPVEGSYDMAFPDGAHARGRFQAVWWKSDAPGG